MGRARDLPYYLVKGGYYALVAVAALAVAYGVYQLILPIVGGVLLMFVIEPIVNHFETRGCRRLSIVLTMCVAAGVVAAAAVYFLVPRLVLEGQSLVRTVPEYRQLIEERLLGVQESLEQRFPEVLWPNPAELLNERLPAGVGTAIGTAAILAGVSSLFSVLSAVAIMPVMAFFFLVDGHRMHKLAMSLVPNQYFEMFVLLTHRIVSTVKQFLRGLLIDSVAVAVLTTVFMTAVGLPYALIVGLVAGLANPVPYLGPVVQLATPLLVVLTGPDGVTALWLVKIVGAFALVQIIENALVYPIVVGRNVDLHPLVVIAGVIVGGKLGGVVVMILAIPIISVVKVSLEVLHAHLKSYSII